MIEELTAGLDWLTLTLPVGALLDEDWVYKGLRCIDDVVKDGNRLEYMSRLGYDGVSAGGCFVGTRQDTHMITMSGMYADRFVKELYRYDCHVSRVDIQVTVKYHKALKRVAKEAYRDATTENETIPIARRRKIYIIVGSDGGDTLYVGSPSSPSRGRLYNKEVQSEDPLYTRSWRYEVMLRNDRATGFMADYQTQFTHRTVYAENYVAQWYETRGVKVPWLYDDKIAPIPPIRTLPTDLERKLNWLAHQVRPTVEYLLTVLDKETILTVLGLS